MSAQGLHKIWEDGGYEKRRVVYGADRVWEKVLRDSRTSGGGGCPWLAGHPHQHSAGDRTVFFVVFVCASDGIGAYRGRPPAHCVEDGRPESETYAVCRVPGWTGKHITEKQLYFMRREGMIVAETITNTFVPDRMEDL